MIEKATSKKVPPMQVTDLRFDDETPAEETDQDEIAKIIEDTPKPVDIPPTKKDSTLV